MVEQKGVMASTSSTEGRGGVSLAELLSPSVLEVVGEEETEWPKDHAYSRRKSEKNANNLCSR